MLSMSDKRKKEVIVYFLADQKFKLMQEDDVPGILISKRFAILS